MNDNVLAINGAFLGGLNDEEPDRLLPSAALTPGLGTATFPASPAVANWLSLDVGVNAGFLSNAVPFFICK